MGAGGGFGLPPSAHDSAPKSAAERQAFARNPGMVEELMGIPKSGTRHTPPADGAVKGPRPSATSSRAQPTSLLGNTTSSNARSTGRSLVKDPAGRGSLLR